MTQERHKREWHNSDETSSSLAIHRHGESSSLTVAPIMAHDAE